MRPGWRQGVLLGGGGQAQKRWSEGLNGGRWELPLGVIQEDGEGGGERESWSGGETGMQAVWGRGRSMTWFQVVSFRPADALVERDLQLEEEFWSSRDS